LAETLCRNFSFGQFLFNFFDLVSAKMMAKHLRIQDSLRLKRIFLRAFPFLNVVQTEPDIFFVVNTKIFLVVLNF